MKKLLLSTLILFDSVLAGCSNAPVTTEKNSTPAAPPSAPVQLKKSLPAAAVKGAVINVDENNFLDVLSDSGDTPVLLYFWAEWCGPCVAGIDTFEKLAREYAGRVVFTSSNTDMDKTMAEAFRVQSIPTYFLFVNMDVVDVTVGVKMNEDLRAFLDKNMSAKKP